MAEIVNMPRLGLNESSSLIGGWSVHEGDKVEKGDELFSIETDKSTMSVYAETSGIVLKIFYDDYDVVEVMTPVCVIGAPGEDISNIIPANQNLQQENIKNESTIEKTNKTQLPNTLIHPENSSNIPRLSPRAKKLADANGINTSGISASGAENRIIEADIIAAMATILQEAQQQAKQNSSPLGAYEGARIVKMSNTRRTIAKNMMSSLQNSAQLTSHITFNASKIQQYRAWLKLSPGDEKTISITDMILFATTKTLMQFDYMNAHLINDDEMIFFDDINLACAVDTDRGLMVPTIMKAQNLSLLQLSQKAKELAAKCRDGSILPEEMSSATFTVSNLGSLGIRDFTPILNSPQVGLLGIGCIDYAFKQTDEGMLYYPAGHLSLSYDHRAIDGAPSARFLKKLCDNLEHFDSLI